MSTVTLEGCWWARGRPRLVRMGGVKIALEAAEDARKIGRNGEPSCICT